MKVEVIDKLTTELSRSPLIDTIDGQYIYSDHNKQYQKVKVPYFERQVSNIESFAAYVLEEANRRGLDQAGGKGMTVIFAENSAKCLLIDAVDKYDSITYHRKLSPQLARVLEKLRSRLSHLELIRVFQSLRDSFVDNYAEFMRQYRKVSFDEKTTFNSQPLVEQGKGGSSIIVEFGRNGGTNNTALPATLKLKLQFARDSKRFYEAELEIDSALSTTNGKAGIEFSLLWPEKENVIAQAVTDEINDFKELVKEKLPNLLIVVNY